MTVLKKPTSLDAVKSVSPSVERLTKHLADIDLTKYRFKTGCWLIVTGIGLFVFSHLLFIDQYFASGFLDHAWTLTRILMFLGAAFAGKEVIGGLVSAIKSFGTKP